MKALGIDPSQALSFSTKGFYNPGNPIKAIVVEPDTPFGFITGGFKDLLSNNHKSLWYQINSINKGEHTFWANKLKKLMNWTDEQYIEFVDYIYRNNIKNISEINKKYPGFTEKYMQVIKEFKKEYSEYNEIVAAGFKVKGIIADDSISRKDIIEYIRDNNTPTLTEEQKNKIKKIIEIATNQKLDIFAK